MGEGQVSLFSKINFNDTLPGVNEHLRRELQACHEARPRPYTDKEKFERRVAYAIGVILLAAFGSYVLVDFQYWVPVFAALVNIAFFGLVGAVHLLYTEYKAADYRPSKVTVGEDSLDAAAVCSDSRAVFLSGLWLEILAWEEDLAVINSLIVMINNQAILLDDVRQAQIAQARERRERLEQRLMLAAHQLGFYGKLGTCHTSIPLTPERLLADPATGLEVGALSVPRVPVHAKRTRQPQ